MTLTKLVQTVEFLSLNLTTTENNSTRTEDRFESKKVEHELEEISTHPAVVADGYSLLETCRLLAARLDLNQNHDFKQQQVSFEGFGINT